MIGADEHSAPFAAGFADAPANSSRGFHLQVYVLGARLNSLLQDVRSLLLLVQTAGGNERYVRFAEQQIYVLFLQGAAVQADFGHFQLPEQRLNLG